MEMTLFYGKPVRYYKYRTAMIKCVIAQVILTKKEENLLKKKIYNLFKEESTNHTVIEFNSFGKTYYVQLEDGAYYIGFEIQIGRW